LKEVDYSTSFFAQFLKKNNNKGVNLITPVLLPFTMHPIEFNIEPISHSIPLLSGRMTIVGFLNLWKITYIEIVWDMEAHLTTI
jgi:hypothetical protein